MAGLVDYAHNDYAKAFLELGLAAPIIGALLLAAYGMRMVELYRRKAGAASPPCSLPPASACCR